MKPRFLAALAALFALAVLCFPASAQQRDQVVLMLNWYNYGEHAPFYLGVARNFYADERIDLEIQEGRGSGITAQAVGAGSATFGYIDIGTMIKAAAKGAPVKSVGVLLQKSPMSAMGFAEKNVTKPAHVVGKTVAMTPGDSLSQIWPVFLKVNNIPDGSFKVVSGDATTKRNAVVNGQADLLLGNANDQAPIIEEVTGKPMRALLFAPSAGHDRAAGQHRGDLRRSSDAAALARHDGGSHLRRSRADHTAALLYQGKPRCVTTM